MHKGRVLVGRLFLTLGLLLLLLPLVRWRVACRWQEQALQQVITPADPNEIVAARRNARLQFADPEQASEQQPDRIEIPKIELQALVLTGITPEVLKLGPGLYPQSGDPQEGNVSIAAHRGVYGAWFRHLDRLESGDTVILQLGNNRYTYSVREQFITHDRDWSVIASDGRAELTLTTCLFGSSDKRLIVKADLVKTK